MNQLIGHAGIDPDPDPIFLHHFQAPGVFPFGIIRLGDNDRATRCRAAAHGTGVGTMHGQFRAVNKDDVCEKAFITSQQDTVLTNGREVHKDTILIFFQEDFSCLLQAACPVPETPGTQVP